MGCTVKERDGAWWVYICFKGRRKAKRLGVGEVGKKAALAAAVKIAAKLACNDPSPLTEVQKPMTFSEYAAVWLKVYAEVHCKLSTVEGYEKDIRLHLRPVFGAMPLPEISRERVKLFLADKLKMGSTQHPGRGLSTSAVRNILIALRAILNQAVDDGVLASNPAARLGKFFKKKDETADDRLDVFTPQEVAHLLAVAEQDFPDAYPAILTLAKTGLRESELFGLQPDDLDFTRRILWVRRAISKGRVGTPKSGKVRRVDLSSQLCHVLQDSLTRRDADAVLAGQEPARWVFPLPNGEPMTPPYLYRWVWHPVLDRAGLRRRGPHQLRHSYASILTAQGAHPKYIQAQLGHHSIQITMDLYGHLFEGDHRRYVEALDGVLDATSRNARATDLPTSPAPLIVSQG